MVHFIVYNKSPTQTSADAKQQQASGELWGRPQKYSDIPQVQAYDGPLPQWPPDRWKQLPGKVGDDVSVDDDRIAAAEWEAGVKLITTTPPNGDAAPGHVRWMGPREGVMVEDGYAKIHVTITKNTQQDL